MPAPWAKLAKGFTPAPGLRDKGLRLISSNAVMALCIILLDQIWIRSGNIPSVWGILGPSPLCSSRRCMRYSIPSNESMKGLSCNSMLCIAFIRMVNLMLCYSHHEMDESSPYTCTHGWRKLCYITNLMSWVQTPRVMGKTTLALGRASSRPFETTHKIDKNTLIRQILRPTMHHMYRTIAWFS